MATITVDSLEKWKRKRKTTTIIFTIETLFLGFEYSVTFLTLWLYIKNLVKPDAPKLYYGFISVAYLLGGLIFSMMVGRIVDAYRCIRLSFFVCNAMVIAGNIIYSLPFSPWLLLLGRFIAGGGGPLRSVISGELARSYKSDEISSKYSTMGMAYSFGFIVGPAINIAFEKVDFWIGKWHIIYENVPGLYMAVFFICLQILSYFYVHDLSKEYDLKADTTENDEDILKNSCLSLTYSNQNNTDDNIISATTFHKPSINKIEIYSESTEKIPLVGTNNSKSICYIFKKLFGNLDTTIILSLSFFTRYLLITADMWFPFLVIDTMHWSVTDMNVIIFAAGIACMVCMVIFSLRPPSDKLIYMLALVSTSFLTIVILVFIVLSYYPANLSLSIPMWIVFCLGWTMVIVNDEIFLVGCLAKMVTSEIQTFSESLRLSISNIGALLALATSALIFDWVLYVGLGYICLVCIAVIIMSCRRNTLSNPKVCIF